MIPNVAHFVWIGPHLPFIYGLAMRSAVQSGGFDEVILHHTEPLTEQVGEPPWFDEVFGPCRPKPGEQLRGAQLRGVQLRRLSPRALLGPLSDKWPGLVEGYQALAVKANQCDILRAALLYLHGGIYLDTDVLVLAPLAELLEHGMFFGSNRSVYDFRESRARGLRRLWLRAKSALRSVLVRLPAGLSLFKLVEGLYPPHLNTAIWGSERGHPALAHILARMAATLREPDLHGRDYNFIGPFLVQSALAERRDADVVCLPPTRFYPLPPVMASWWFRRQKNAQACLPTVLSPDTLVAHWYASGDVATFIKETSPASIRAAAPHQLFSAMALPFLP